MNTCDGIADDGLSTGFFFGAAGFAKNSNSLSSLELLLSDAVSICFLLDRFFFFFCVKTLNAKFARLDYTRQVTSARIYLPPNTAAALDIFYLTLMMHLSGKWL